MNRIALLGTLLILLFFNSLQAQPAWQRAALSSSADFKGAHLLDARYGYVVGSEGTIWGTTNGGESWHMLPAPTTEGLWGVHSSPGPEGPIVVVAGDNGVAFRSTDDGATWNQLDVPYTRGFLFGLYGYNADILCITGGEGEFSSPVGVIATTRDGGLTWKKSRIEGTFTFDKSYFASTHTGYAVGSVDANFSEGMIYRTTDGGDTWRRVATLPGAVNSIHCFDTLNCIAVGFNGLARRTTDGGSTWSTVAIPSQYSGDPFTHVSFFDDDQGYITDAAGAILKSVDGGMTWSRDEEFAGGSVLWGLALAGGRAERVALAVGDGGAVFRLKQTSASVEGDGRGEAFDVRFDAAGREGEVQVTARTGGALHIQLYDMLGRECLSIFEGEVEAGTRRLVFDGRSLTNGVYFCTARFADRVLSAPLLVP